MAIIWLEGTVTSTVVMGNSMNLKNVMMVTLMMEMGVTLPAVLSYTSHALIPRFLVMMSDSEIHF
jgi:hypothetical protein